MFNKYGVNCFHATECRNYMFYNSFDKLNKLIKSKKIFGVDTDEYRLLRDLFDDYINGRLNRFSYIQALSVLNLDKDIFENIIIEAAVSAKNAGYDIDASLTNRNIFDNLTNTQESDSERPIF